MVGVIILFSLVMKEATFLLLCSLCDKVTGDRIGSELGKSLL